MNKAEMDLRRDWQNFCSETGEFMGFSEWLEMMIDSLEYNIRSTPEDFDLQDQLYLEALRTRLEGI